MLSFTIAVHGGAGELDPAKIDAAKRASYRAGLEAALLAGQRILADGGDALEAAVAAVEILELDPLFNAGRGSVLNAAGEVEMDASLMDGRDRRAGAVGLVRAVRHPIRLAHAVMTRTPHVLLAGPAAEDLAAGLGLGREEPGWFITEERFEQWRAYTADLQAAVTGEAPGGTVGAVVRDPRGHLAAATSTGGRLSKLPGRIGDSAVIGAGTWAWDRACAVSGTGHGERFIQANVASRISNLVELAGASLAAACDQALAEAAALGGYGGVIAVDAAGNVALPFNTPGMLRGVLREDGVARVGIWEELEPA